MNDSCFICFGIDCYFLLHHVLASTKPTIVISMTQKAVNRCKLASPSFPMKAGKPITTGDRMQIPATTIRNRFTFASFRSSSLAVL